MSLPPFFTRALADAAASPSGIEVGNSSLTYFLFLISLLFVAAGWRLLKRALRIL